MTSQGLRNQTVTSDTIPFWMCVWPCLKDDLSAGRRTKNRITRAALPMTTSRHAKMATSGLFFSEKKNQTKKKGQHSVAVWGLNREAARTAECKLTSKGPKHHSFSGCWCLSWTPVQGCGRQSNPKCFCFILSWAEGKYLNPNYGPVVQ